MIFEYWSCSPFSALNVFLKFQYIVDPGALSINLVVPLDVVIGTIPFISFAPSAPVVPNVHHQDLNHWVIPGILRGDQPIDASTRKFLAIKFNS